MPASSADLAIGTPHADLAACRARLAGGSRSFHAASHLLPSRVGEAACQLYAFCREADDLIDEGGDAPRALAGLERRLSAIYRGEPGASATDRALQAVVSRYRLPRTLLDALLEGFAWDAACRRYRSLSGVFDYSARVAGSIGIMMALLMDERSPGALARAADLGVAMQLTNIARDVGEDARAGRLYLPSDWLLEAGIDPDAFLAEPRFSAGLASVIGRLLEEAGRLYRRADSGIAALPRACRPGIYAARLLYAEIGEQLSLRGHDAVARRSVVPATRKLALLARIPAVARLGADALDQPPLVETRFLVSAVDPAATGPAARPGDTDNPLKRFGRRMVWMLELFEALEARDRAGLGERAG